MKVDDKTIDVVDAFLSEHEPIVEPHALSDGVLLGGWRVLAYLGKGASGEVYQVENVTSGKVAAAKVLVRTDAAAHERFSREVSVLASSTSSALPQYFTSGESDGRPFVILELLERRSLPNEDRAVADYMLDVCAGVAELHRLGIVHRDVKPSNVLFRPDGHAVLIDFGLAKRTELSKRLEPDSVSIVDGHAVGVGTPRYAAPEQFIGGEVSAATDIHALGMLANECFEGKPPLGWRTLIRRSTSSIPSQRYAGVAAFARAIRRRHALRHTLSALGAVALLAAIVGLALYLLMPAVPAVMELNGQIRVLSEPLRLEGGHTYEIVGPGTLDADISGPTNATLRLKNCILLNRSCTLRPGVGPYYELSYGAYLNFINMNRMPSDLKMKDLVAPYNYKECDVRFHGPTTINGLMHLKNAEWYERKRFDEGYRPRRAL